jgi:hypothetical protein
MNGMDGLQTEPVGLTWEEKKECGVEEGKRERGKRADIFKQRWRKKGRKQEQAKG